MKRVLAFLLGLVTVAVAGLTLTAAAGAENVGPNGEVASASMSATPRKGTLYKGGFVPSNWKIEVEVTQPPPEPPATSKDILPLKRVKVNFGRDIIFKPSNKTKVCPDNKVGPGGNMSRPPADIIALCPKSVIGNGTADLYLGHKNNGNGPHLSLEKDSAAVLIAFDGGKQNGRPKIKIYGYSKQTTAGIYMETVLQPDGTLDIAVPPLSADSAVGRFDLNLPGSTPIRYDRRTLPQSVGQDPNYLQAKCSTGSWLLTSEFVLGERPGGFENPGGPEGPETTLTAPDFTENCVGKAGKPPAGKAKLGAVKVNGKAKAKRGKAQVYKVRVKNAGNAPARGVVVVAKGKGVKGKTKVKIGNIPAKKAKVGKLKLKFTKKGKSKVTFTIRSNNAGNKKANKVVRVR